MDYISDIINNVRTLLFQHGWTDSKLHADIGDAISYEVSRFELKEKERSVVVYDKGDQALIGRYFIAKGTAGLSQRTLEVYRKVLKDAMKNIGKHIPDITADDVRLYLVQKKMNGVSDRSIDNIRRDLSSFFGWLHREELIPKNPMLRIEKVKFMNRHKSPLTELEMETLRTKAKNLRDRAIIEFLYSTGCRVSECVSLNRTDIDLQNGECIVLGKGNKERKVFISPRCLVLLINYLNSRTDEHPALFVSFDHRKKEYRRFLKSGIEVMVRVLGRRNGIPNVHPHRIRRTCATDALRRGMPIEQVSKMLGHADLKTTTIYASSTEDDVKASHGKFVR